jgi:AmmeMemoRadiSam system protein A
MSELGVDDQVLILRIARRAVEAAVRGEGAPSLPANLPAAVRRRAGAFVTLHVDGDLRGCIGHVEARRALAETVAQAAASATLDRRFPPLAPQDLAHLQIEVSVLSALAPMLPAHVEVGVHGLLIECGGRAGLLLPQVPIEHGWDRETFLDHLCRKAGLPAGSWKRADARIFAFTAHVFGE